MNGYLMIMCIVISKIMYLVLISQKTGVTGGRILLTTGAKLLDSTVSQEIGFCANNIYDLGGNAGEWSTEMLKSDNSHRISGWSFEDGSSWIGGIDNNSNPYQSGLTGDISTSSRPILYK